MQSARQKIPVGVSTRYAPVDTRFPPGEASLRQDRNQFSTVFENPQASQEGLSKVFNGRAKSDGLVPFALASFLGAFILRLMELVITLLFVGALLLLAESILPGMIAGIIGVCCLVAGVIAGYIQFGAQKGNLIALGVLFGLVVGFSLWFKYFPDSRLARVFVSRRTSGEVKEQNSVLLNQTGTAFTALRPAGTAIIGGKRVDVVTEGQLIEKGAPIQVVAADGMRVVVRTL
jgi:membrane-bound serine protease (ClpP class)